MFEEGFDETKLKELIGGTSWKEGSGGEGEKGKQ